MRDENEATPLKSFLFFVFIVSSVSTLLFEKNVNDNIVKAIDSLFRGALSLSLSFILSLALFTAPPSFFFTRTHSVCYDFCETVADDRSSGFHSCPSVLMRVEGECELEYKCATQLNWLLVVPFSITQELSFRFWERKKIRCVARSSYRRLYYVRCASSSSSLVMWSNNYRTISRTTNRESEK